jgi:CRISPR-associated DxTHG motif protein
MTTKAISFLGYTRPDLPYRDATYAYAGQEWTTPFMAEATARFFKPDVLLVLVTEEARRQNYGDLAKRIGDHTHIQPVDIPSGKTEGELWRMFEAIAQNIAVGDRVIFDITNGFRSLPVLAFLAASFVRVVRGVTVEKMIYGAFDATAEGRTPVFDLTPFVQLLDWTTATDAFLKYGRADDLPALVKCVPEYAQLGSTLQSLTAALQTSRPSETLEQAHQLALAIAQAQPTAAATQPFGLLLDRISEEYSPLAHAHPTDPNLARDVVAKQLEIIDWYIDKRMFVQALTAEREWMVSLTLMYAHESLFDKGRRNEAEKLIRHERTPAFAAQVLNIDAIRAVWAQTTPARNAVAHHGWSLTTLSAQEIQDAAQNVCRQLRALMQ